MSYVCSLLFLFIIAPSSSDDFITTTGGNSSEGTTQHPRKLVPIIAASVIGGTVGIALMAAIIVIAVALKLRQFKKKHHVVGISFNNALYGASKSKPCLLTIVVTVPRQIQNFWRGVLFYCISYATYPNMVKNTPIFCSQNGKWGLLSSLRKIEEPPMSCSTKGRYISRTSVVWIIMADGG